MKGKQIMKKSAFKIGDKISGEVAVIFAAVTNTELNEGRGVPYDKSYHLNHANATIGASGIGVMGCDGTVEPRIALQISDGKFIILPEQELRITTFAKETARLRKSALAKLSPAEKAALL